MQRISVPPLRDSLATCTVREVRERDESETSRLLRAARRARSRFRRGRSRDLPQSLHTPSRTRGSVAALTGMASSRHEKLRRIGVFDLGSNTILLLVMDSDGAVLRDLARITRLGQGVFESGELAPAAVARTEAAIA